MTTLTSPPLARRLSFRGIEVARACAADGDAGVVEGVVEGAVEGAVEGGVDEDAGDGDGEGGGVGDGEGGRCTALSNTISDVGNTFDVTTHFRSGVASIPNCTEPDHRFSIAARCCRAAGERGLTIRAVIAAFFPTLFR